MKRLLFILFILPGFVFGQQFLWSTTETPRQRGTDVPRIPITDVRGKVMDYYNFYNFYYDLTGFSREGFKEFLKNDLKAANSIQWDPAMTFDEPTAFAFKGNDGRGSFVVVMLLQKENIDLLLFSNEVGQGAISTGVTEKFSKWFSSFWDYGMAVGGSDLSIQSRGWAVPPNIDDNVQQAGVVMVEVRVASDGRITFARVSLEETTLTDKALWDKCERAVRSARLNAIEGAPREQRGLIPFRFQLK